jgi:hypothetical protein
MFFFKHLPDLLVKLYLRWQLTWRTKYPLQINIKLWEACKCVQIKHHKMLCMITFCKIHHKQSGSYRLSKRNRPSEQKPNKPSWADPLKISYHNKINNNNPHDLRLISSSPGTRHMSSEFRTHAKHDGDSSVRLPHKRYCGRRASTLVKVMINPGVSH